MSLISAAGLVVVAVVLAIAGHATEDLTYYVLSACYALASLGALDYYLRKVRR